MKLRLLGFFLLFACALGAQTPSNLTLGGVRIDTDCKGTGDPNTVLGNQFPQYECETFKDTVNGKTWKYYPTQTPKWRVSIDSAGSYMNENVRGVISLGGVSKLPQGTAVILDMGGPAVEDRAFNIGYMGTVDPVYPAFSNPVEDRFGINVSPYNYGIALGSSRISGSRFSRLTVGDERTATDFLGMDYESGHKLLSAGYGAAGTLTYSYYDRPDFSNPGGAQRSDKMHSITGTNISFSLREQNVIPFVSGQKSNGFTNSKTSMRTRLGESVSSSVNYDLSSYDQSDASGTALNRFTLHHMGFAPNRNNDSIAFHVIFGEKTSFYESALSSANISVYGSNGRMWALRQNRFKNISDPKAFDWILVDPLDGTETGDKIKFYNNKYALPNATPSITNLDKSVIVWTGNGTTTTPAFETLPTGLSTGTVENGLEFVSGKIGQGSALVRNTTIPGAGFNYEMSALNQLLFTTTSGTRTTSIQANNTGAVGVNIVNTNTSTNDRGTVKANADSFSYLGNDNTVSGSTGVVQTYSAGQVDVKATDGGANTRIIRVEDDKMSLVNLAASSGGTFTKQIVLDPATYEIRMENKTSVSPQEEFFTATGGQTAFTIAVSQAAPSGNTYPLRVYRNGVKLKYVASAPGVAEFTYSGTGITTAANLAGDIITAEYFN